MARRSGNGSPTSLRDTVAQRGRQIADAARARVEEVDVLEVAAAAAQAVGGAIPSIGEPPPKRRHAPRGPVPGWLRLVVELLPATTKQQVRDILREPPPEFARSAPDSSAAAMELNATREHLRQTREDLKLRESALDAARAEVERARYAMDATRIELDAREREVERALAEARRAAAESTTERLVPRAHLRWSASESPRPLRGIARLAANIQRYGQLTPVVARVADDGALQVVSGHRRMAALERIGATHVRLRVVPNLDDETMAALYVAENCLVDGVSSKAVAQLAVRLGDSAGVGFGLVLAAVQADDEAVVEEVTLEELVSEARHHLAEGAAWVAALRPYWGEVEQVDKQALGQLVTWFARMASRLRVE